MDYACFDTQITSGYSKLNWRGEEDEEEEEEGKCN